jgi:hypothetical protein
MRLKSKFIFLLLFFSFLGIAEAKSNSKQLPAKVKQFLKEYNATIGSGDETKIKSFLAPHLIDAWGKNTIHNLATDNQKQIKDIVIVDWLQKSGKYFVQWMPKKDAKSEKDKIFAWYVITTGGPHGFQIADVSSDYDPRDTAR